MTIGIIYGTNSGGTGEVAKLIRDELATNHVVTLINARDAKPEQLGAFDLCIIGSCTWELITKERRFEGTLQEHWLALRDALKGKTFSGKRFAVFGLGDATYTSFCIAANHLEALVKQLQGIQIGTTLRVNRFYFDLTTNRGLIKSWAKTIAHALEQPA